MTDDRKNLGQLLAVDMPNGFTYIGRSHTGESIHLMLKDSLLIETKYLTQSNNNKYVKSAKEEYAKQKEEFRKRNQNR